jgi:glycosyltransferase involved in cell wall biosynthesis
MKIAIQLLNTLKHGGGENVALNYAKILRDMNVSSVFVGKKYSHNYVRTISGVGSIEDCLSKKLVESADYIFVHTNYQLIQLIRFFFTIKYRRKRVIYVQHLKYSDLKFIALSFFINLICTDFIRITPITESLVNKCITVKKHFIVNFFLSKYLSKDYDAIRKDVRGKLGLGNEKTIVVFSGVFKEGKGLDDMLRLADKMKNSSELVFLILGDGPEKFKIDSYAGGNIVWTGFVDDVEKYLIASDIYFFPSKFKYEMLPMALVEAMNAGLNIIAYDTEINRFLLEGNVCASFEEASLRIFKRNFPNTLKKYDYPYANETFRNLL